MIQAGTIRIGSGATVEVAGLYWISSISRLRNTTLPGVTATLRPTSGLGTAVPGAFAIACLASSRKCRSPSARFLPPEATVRCSTTGLLGRKFDGATVSSS